MEIWLDTLNSETIKKAESATVLTGVTTNPSILGKERRSLEEVVKELIELQKGLVAVQVIASTTEAMISQALELNRFSSRIIPKIPTTEEGIKAITALDNQGILTMATTVFSPLQFFWAAKAGAAYVAPYFSKLDNGLDTLKKISEISKIYPFKTKIIAASLKSLPQLMECMSLGIHAATLKEDLFEESFATHSLTEEYVSKFANDWQAVPKSSFTF